MTFFVGDVNGDGFDDVVFGSLLSGSFFTGAAHILVGDLNGMSNMVTVKGSEWQNCGFSVSGAGKFTTFVFFGIKVLPLV